LQSGKSGKGKENNIEQTFDQREYFKNIKIAFSDPVVFTGCG
jgi:hypothetical protein